MILCLKPVKNHAKIKIDKCIDFVKYQKNSFIDKMYNNAICTTKNGGKNRYNLYYAKIVQKIKGFQL